MTAEQSRQTGGYYAQQWTVRDEHAARLAPEIIAGSLAAYRADRVDLSLYPKDQIRALYKAWAMASYEIADAMLAERRRSSGKELANDIAVVPPDGAPYAEDAIRAGRDGLPAHEHRYACFNIYGELSTGCPDYDPPDAVNPYAKPYDDVLAAHERLRRHLPAH